MIIKLSPAEVKGYVSAALNLNPSRFEIEIVAPDKSLLAPDKSLLAPDKSLLAPDKSLLAAFRIAINEFPRFAFDDKIKCIKRFRELGPKYFDNEGCSCCTVGLADAKWAVENADLALANLERTGSIRG